VYERALAIRLKVLGETDPLVGQTMSGYASALRGLHRDTEAQQMEARAQPIARQSVTAK
jgi:Tetratricopeptide repeat